MTKIKQIGEYCFTQGKYKTTLTANTQNQLYLDEKFLRAILDFELIQENGVL